MRTFLTLAAVLASLAPVPAQARGAPRKAVVLLIARDRTAASSVLRVSEFLEGAVQRNADYQLVGASAALGDTSPGQALASRRKVIESLAEAKKLLSKDKLDQAEEVLKAALRDSEIAVAAMERCAEYCEALAQMAALKHARSDVQGARDWLRRLFVVDRGIKLDGPGFPRQLVALANEVQRAMNAEGAVASATIQTNPSGARVFVDGAFRGFAPAAVDRLASGRHLLRVERPGYVTHGELVEVGGGEETTLKVKLVATAEFAAIEPVLDKVADELAQGRAGGEVQKLGPRLGAERGVLGVMRASGDGKLTLECSVVDFPAARQLARKSRTFEGDEYGQLEREVQKYANLLLTEANSKPVARKKGGDPLGDRSGMEDWNEDGPERDR